MQVTKKPPSIILSIHYPNVVMFHATQRNSSISQTVTFQCICSPLINNFQKLKELNIDVDWELPRLHQLDNGSQKMSIKLLQKKMQSGKIKLSSTNFTEKEQIKIKRNWIKFCEVILLNKLICKLDKSSIQEILTTNPLFIAYVV